MRELKETLNYALNYCVENVPDVVGAFGLTAKQACYALWGSIISSVMIAIWAREAVLVEEEKRYKKEVEGKKEEYQLDLLDSTYENVIKNHGNIITTFKQLRLVAENLNAKALQDFERENRNLQLVDCESTVLGFKEQCDKPSCEDRTRLCDGSWNYRYIATLEGGEFSTAHNLLSNSIIKLNTSDFPFYSRLRWF
jgi:hypothetical protein